MIPIERNVLQGCAHRPAPPSGAFQVAVLDNAGLPIQVLIIPRATALDTLEFISSLISLIGREQLAQRDGLTFDHPLAASIGALPPALSVHIPKVQYEFIHLDV
jgi:hypothetical protein